MKFKIIVVLISCFVSLNCFCQATDSTRSLNDKPGTPQSLRNSESRPKNRVHTITPNKPAPQTINHGATESNKVIEKPKPAILVPDAANKTQETKTPVTIAPQNNPPAIDTSGPVKSLSTGQDNVTNPIRK